MVGHGGSSAGSYLADPTSPIPSHCASIVATSTLRVKQWVQNTLEHASYDHEDVFLYCYPDCLSSPANAIQNGPGNLSNLRFNKGIHSELQLVLLIGQSESPQLRYQSVHPEPH